MIRHLIASLLRRPPSVRRILALFVMTLATALLSGVSGPASAAARHCAAHQIAHGKRCVARPVKRGHHAAALKPRRHPAVHRKPRRRAVPKHSVVSHERLHRKRAARGTNAKRKPKPPVRHAAPAIARTADPIGDFAKPQLLAGCGYTPATRRLLRSRSIYVVDERTGTVLLERNARQIRPIASVSKLMTAVVWLDRRAPMATKIRVTAADRDTIKFTGSRLKVGSVLSRSDMLHIALMSSENRAAAALSRDYPGGRPAFLAAMNRKARALGMSNSHFVSPTGLSPHNVSTARDLAQLVAAANRYTPIRAFSTDRGQTVRPGHGQLRYVNSNALVRGGDRRITLQKTGFINEAGHCVVIRYLIDGRPVDIVLLDAPGPADHIADAIRIRNWLACSLH
ncbi:serine hydrolase [Burkholderia sp. Ac-20379]|uniref:serine hydrolase n=1 Tax=Burkholderia sp. Ac-20379 TaxID=2703900 RepID=UPI00197F3901|nr:serine hydrolase [Burkholderia sp. Ac-20379]MBN3728008.1 D-alanyl-D-alanine carboxypeptidase [Burkholderia sp. Ac-20379]